MTEDIVRVATIAATALALTATALIGVAEAPTGVRVPAPPVPAAPTADTVIVEPGDHFWKISARRLAETTEPVGPYWRRVVDHNRDMIRSGDPDLIFPGEVVELPEP